MEIVKRNMKKLKENVAKMKVRNDHRLQPKNKTLKEQKMKS